MTQGIYGKLKWGIRLVFGYFASIIKKAYFIASSICHQFWLSTLSGIGANHSTNLRVNDSPTTQKEQIHNVGFHGENTCNVEQPPKQLLFKQELNQTLTQLPESPDTLRVRLKPSPKTSPPSSPQVGDHESVRHNRTRYDS